MNKPERPGVPERTPSVFEDLFATRDSADQSLLPPDRRVTQSGRKFEQRSLFGEILDWMFAPLMLVWPLSVAITFLGARALADAPYDRVIADRVRVLAEQVRVVDDKVVVNLRRSTREMLGASEDDTIYLQVIGPLGELLLGESDLPRPPLYDFPDPGIAKIRNEQYHGEEIRVAYMYFTPETDRSQSRLMFVQVAETGEKRSRLANEIIRGVLFPQFLILPLAIGLVWFGLGRGLAPLQSLQQRIRNRRPDDLSAIDPREAPEEVSPLVDAFNELLARLNKNFSAQRRFIADAAHQMKTPLAGLRTQAELALRQSDPAELRKSLEQLARGSERAAHLISQLLALARTENLRDQLQLEQLDLNPLVRSIVTDFAALAISKEIDFGVETDDEPAPIAGQPILLRELCNNLIDNALRYTPREGTVTARVRVTPAEVVFEVEDSGPGIAVADRDLVFERFFRVLGSQVDGSGLGLAIVREIANQHQADVSLHDSRPGRTPPGTIARVRFAKVREGI